jgi:septum formation protein
VLGSASPRRRELLQLLVPDFTVLPSDVEERLDPPPCPAAAARLALVKARAVAGRVVAGIVLGADTIVVLDGEPLGKPADPADAVRMLRRLRGRAHDVVTGVAVVEAPAGREASAAVVTRVLMADYDDALIEAYVASGAPMDKAGAYAIQDLDGALVAGLVGSYTNVVGLPLGETARLLAGFGVRVRPVAA